MTDANKGLQNMRKAKGLSAKELARQVGIATSAIWAYENGGKTISKAHAGRLAEFFGVSPDELLSQ